MTVFDNLKNFIRQGKQASSKNARSSSTYRQASSSSLDDAMTSHAKNRASSVSLEHNHKHAADAPTDHIDEKSHRSSVSHYQPGTHGAGAAGAAATDSHHHHAEDGKKHSGSPRKKKAHKYDNAVKQIIAEENESRSRMPSYPGLERYRLVEKMGDGAFSIVYRAHDMEVDEPRAIKVVSKHSLTSSQRASVLKEAAIMRQLNHESIVHMYAFLDTPEYYFIVLELVEGGELFHQIVHLTYFSEDLSRHVILQVANAVRYLHEEAGVVHRDIKPENLLFTHVPYIRSKQRVLRPGDDDTKEDEGEFMPGVGGGGVGTIKLADFGLSKIIWDTKTMTPCGTVGYTAPEIVKDEKYSKSVDMWALGCVLYTILCGFPPFYDESIEMLTHKVAMGQYTFLSPWWDGISDSAKDLVSRLLTVDPEKRYTIDEFLQHPWITQGDAKLPTSSEVASHMVPSVPSTPLHERGGVRDVVRSGALKDAFDVSNAVYRLEQEMARHNQKVARNQAAIIEEDDENAAEFAHVEHAFDKMSLNSQRSTPQSSQGPANVSNQQAQRSTRTASPSVGSTRAAARRAAAAGNTGSGGPTFFDLHLEGSTLLERRKARQAPLAH